jgi:hypothetical protein
MKKGNFSLHVIDPPQAKYLFSSKLFLQRMKQKKKKMKKKKKKKELHSQLKPIIRICKY